MMTMAIPIQPKQMKNSSDTNEAGVPCSMLYGKCGIVVIPNAANGSSLYKPAKNITEKRPWQNGG